MNQQHIRILHVENNGDDIEIVARVLQRRQDVSLVSARTIQEAKKQISENEFDLIFADLLMSDNDGREAGPERNRVQNALFDFQRLMRELDIDKGSLNREERPAIVVLSGMPITKDDIKKTINTYPGWIWGWLEKLTLGADGSETLENSINEAIGDLQLHRKRSRRLIYDSVWPGGTMSLLAYVVGVALIWGIYQLTQNIVLTSFASIVPIGLMIATQAYYLKSQDELSEESYRAIISQILKRMFTSHS